MSQPQEFEISFVGLEQEWDELMLAFWKSWKSPLQASGELTFPHLGTNTPQEEEAFNNTKISLLKEARDNSDAIYWVKGVDKATNRIVGAICFKHEKKWPVEGTGFTGCGFKPGSERQELSDSFYRQLLMWRILLMKHEHICKRPGFFKRKEFA